MLSVGREIGIHTKSFVCRECTWEGRGPELATGLVRISQTAIYVYAYRCPGCASFDITAKGKLLAFRSPAAPITHENGKRDNQDEAAAQHSVAMEKSNRSWK
jgi:hypothetical protein